ncbi:hypothetical protein V3C99_002940 [Haemonchus contortus]
MSSIMEPLATIWFNQSDVFRYPPTEIREAVKGTIGSPRTKYGASILKCPSLSPPRSSSSGKGKWFWAIVWRRERISPVSGSAQGKYEPLIVRRASSTDNVFDGFLCVHCSVGVTGGMGTL